MSDKMTCMSFAQLMNWVIREHDTKGTVFGVHRPYKADTEKDWKIFGRSLETPIGPAAGPNSQLAQNIIASYYAGARFFELKTVQIMDGAELAACVNKPCINAKDECYNCEWSTELYVPEAQDEYIKAWFVLHVIAKEYGLGAQDGFQFNISVGYDLAGIKSPKIDLFIESMKDARGTDTWKTCTTYLEEHIDDFEYFTKEDLDAIPSAVCNSVTISTLHGCPTQEIESIANYLLDEKGFHTFIKCNPTLLGYEFARETMDKMGYDYLVFGRFHFEDDLQYADAIPMLTRLMTKADSLGLQFGVKITNTFPVDVKAGELPSEEMYMSGKSLYPLSISLAAKLSEEFDGKLRIAYSGGADAFNIDRIVECGVWPVTVATTILKTGGCQRMEQLAKKLEPLAGNKDSLTGTTEQPVENFAAFEGDCFTGIDVDKLNELALLAITDAHHVKAAKIPPSRKSDQPVPLMNCFIAPCEEGCPIHQDVSAYMKLWEEGKIEEGLRVILDKNALPFITGTICAHPCMSQCTRNFYESPVRIRETKLAIAEQAFDKIIEEIKPAKCCGKKAAVVGGGPAGMAAAFYLARAGVAVTLYEKREALGGIVNFIVPDFRIDGKIIEKDAAFLKKLGVTMKFNTEISSVADLREQGYDAVVLAVGAYKKGILKVDGCEVLNAIDFLEDFNKTKANVKLGENVAVIGGGNTAIDTARAAKRNAGVKKVSLVYRRTKRYMPADEEELLLAVEDGVEFAELLATVKWEDGKLICQKMVLGEKDASGRANIAAVDEYVDIPADTVIAAVGEKVPVDFYESNGINVDEKGRPKVSEKLESSVSGVYVVGDGLFGPSVVVKVMAQAKQAAEAIIGASVSSDVSLAASKERIFAKKGILTEPDDTDCEGKRCLSCSAICENCVDVCPNRANISVQVPGFDMAQIIHVDYMCNECGNCNTFCPYSTAPYKNKFTLFANEADMKDSKNDGFVVLDAAAKKYKVRFLGNEMDGDKVFPGLKSIMDAVVDDYAYMII